MKNLSSKKKGLTGEHGSPVKSRAARGAAPHCISAEMPRLGVQGAVLIFRSGTHPRFPLARSLLDRSSGPFSLFPTARGAAGAPFD